MRAINYKLELANYLPAYMIPSYFMSLKTEDGWALIGFVGPGQIINWRQFYTDWCEEHGWFVETAWRRDGVNWLGRFANKETRIEIQISAQPDYLSGMVTITPRRNQADD